jgi:hypothetical protein
VTTDQTPHLPPLTSNCGILDRTCNPVEEYITCITTTLQNLASRSRASSRASRQEGHTLRHSRQVIPPRTYQTVSETDLMQRELPSLPGEYRQVPTPIQQATSIGPVEVTGFPPRPFLPEHIYLSTTIPNRNRDEQLAFLRHCQYLQQGCPSYQITHTLTELYILTPSPAVFIRFLWRYKIYINQNGVLEDYHVIISDNQGTNLAKQFTVYHS